MADGGRGEAGQGPVRLRQPEVPRVRDAPDVGGQLCLRRGRTEEERACQGQDRLLLFFLKPSLRKVPSRKQNQ